MVLFVFLELPNVESRTCLVEVSVTLADLKSWQRHHTWSMQWPKKMGIQTGSGKCNLKLTDTSRVALRGGGNEFDTFDRHSTPWTLAAGSSSITALVARGICNLFFY